MDTDEKTPRKQEPLNESQTSGPFGSDDTHADRAESDNKHRYDQENSPNGLDSEQVRGGQDGRNIRAIGSTDMDSQHGLLRMGDADDSQMDVTDEGLASATQGEAKTNTATADVTTSGPDDYASAGQVGVPNAQKEAKQQDDREQGQDTPASEEAPETSDDEIARTGTDLGNQPTY